MHWLFAAKLHSSHQIGIPGRSRFRLISKLLQGSSLHLTGLYIVGISKDQVIGDSGHQLIVASVIISGQPLQDSICPSHVLGYISGKLLRRKPFQVDGIGIVESQVFLICGLYTHVYLAVESMSIPVLLQGLGKNDHICDLIHGIALVDEVQGLIIDVLVHIPLVF